MAVILPNSIFLHIPKCGGTWVREAIACAGIPYRETGQEEGSKEKRSHEEKVKWNHADYKQASPFFEGRFVFTFVRFPPKWYQSFWSYKMINRGVEHAPTAFDEYMCDDFNEFVMRATSGSPGALTDLYESYTGWPIKVGMVGRQESLRPDLINALNVAQEMFTPMAFKWIPMINQASTDSEWKPHCKYSAKARDAVDNSERLAFERYGYDNETGPIEGWQGYESKA